MMRYTGSEPALVLPRCVSLGTLAHIGHLQVSRVSSGFRNLSSHDVMNIRLLNYIKSALRCFSYRACQLSHLLSP